MKKVLLGLLALSATTALAVGVTRAYFSDTETSEVNTFTAGTLDLTINGENDPFSMLFSADNMVPGDQYLAGKVTLQNAGSLPGKLTVKVSNPVSNENGLMEPELDDGDADGVQVDNSGYSAESGDGELWDQTAIKICINSGAGSHATNDKCDWDDTIIYSNYGVPGNDYSSYYSLPLDTDLAADNSVTLESGEAAELLVETAFIEDTSNWWWGGMSGVTNNMAMSDDAMFDLVVGLKQI